MTVQFFFLILILCHTGKIYYQSMVPRMVVNFMVRIVLRFCTHFFFAGRVNNDFIYLNANYFFHSSRQIITPPIKLSHE